MSNQDGGGLHLVKLITKTIPPINKEGYPFILIFAVITLVIGFFWDEFLWIGGILTAWCAYFFRDPDRMVPDGDSLIISPADGLVQKIEKAKIPVELGVEGERTRVSVFLNVFDVHVNRSPIAGEISELHYHPGKFLSADLDKASEDNERQTMVVKTADGKEIICVQIAGLVARRIVCNVQEKQTLEAGQRYGLIRFGSRVDIYLPDGVNPQVVVGQRAIAGETVIADLKSKAAAKTGTKR